MKLKKFGEMEPKEKKAKKNVFGALFSKFKKEDIEAEEVIAEAEEIAGEVAQELTEEATDAVEDVQAEVTEEAEESEAPEKLSRGKAVAAKIKSNKFAMAIATKLMKKKDVNGEDEVGAPVKMKKQSMLFSIRNKIFICFLVPIAFMIVVGVAAYQKSSEGMQDKFQESTEQTMKMLGEYIEMSNSFIETDALTFVMDAQLNNYAIGLLDDDMNAMADIVKLTKKNITAAQTSNDFLANIHIVPVAGKKVMTTKKMDVGTTEPDGFYDEYLADVPMDGKNPQKWIDHHDLLDETLGLEKEDYILSYELPGQNKKHLVIYDVSSKYYKAVLEEVDLGNGSIIGLVTENGRELIYESLEEGQESTIVEGEPVFFGKDFYYNLITPLQFHLSRFLFFHTYFA